MINLQPLSSFKVLDFPLFSRYALWDRTSAVSLIFESVVREIKALVGAFSVEMETLDHNSEKNKP